MSLFLRWFCLVLILFAVGVAYVTMPAEDEFNSRADEGFYFRYAQNVSQAGIKVIPLMLEEYMTTPAAQLYPHPGRVGHVLLNGAWFKIFPKTLRSLAHFSFLCFLLFLWVSFVFARKYLGQDVALWYTILLSSSPLLMAASRRVLQDSVLNLFWALSFWFFFDYLMTRKRQNFVFFCVFFVVALTIKEASLPVWAFFVLAWFVFKFCFQRDLPWRDLGYLFIPLFSAVMVYILFLGGYRNFEILVDFVFQLQTIAMKDIVNDTYPLFAQGPWYKFLIDFLLLSPFVTLLFLGYFFHLLMGRKMDAIRTYGLLFFVLIFGMFSSREHIKIIRFVMSLEIVMYLFAVFALVELFRFKNKSLTGYFVSLSVFLIYFANILNYSLLYCDRRIYDPISILLMLAHQIIPQFATRI